MALKLPNLDDRSYADLVQEARSILSTYSPEWTNHNPSDPGITLIELFAYHTEMLTYRLNRITDANKLKFLKLLNGPTWTPQEGKPLSDQIRATLREFRQPNRAISREDFERLARNADPMILRSHCIPGHNLAQARRFALREKSPGHVSVIVLPKSADRKPEPSPELLKKVATYLEPRRLLTTKVHVVGPRYLPIKIRVGLTLTKDGVKQNVRKNIVSELKEFFSPVPLLRNAEGWPFGRNVYVSELYELLDRQIGVDYVNHFDLATENVPNREEKNSDGELIAIQLMEDELVQIDCEEVGDTIQFLEQDTLGG